ncbi:MAG: STAS domain-containing protein [Streptomycetaceae bacterium]|jgi:anti-sigma B factor antagonist|nr:STAS domain-containing protein [Streptomycetaceae bacterium]
MSRSPRDGRQAPHPPPVALLTIDVRRDGDHRVQVRVAGELDQDTAPQLRRAVSAALRGHPAALHIDLAGVPFADSAGLHILLDTRSRLDGWGGTLTVDAGEQVRDLLRLTGTTPLFTLVDGVPGPTPKSG